MKVLLDTDAIIPVEPTALEEVEEDTELLALIQRTAQLGGHQVFVHPDSLAELDGDVNELRRAVRRKLVLRYPVLPSPPDISKELSDLVGVAQPGSHDEVDDRLIAAVYEDAVDLLISDDKKIHTKSVRAGLAERVGTPADILEKLERTLPRDPFPPPAVRRAYCHELDLSDEIFDGLRSDYAGFDEWMKKCRLQHRTAWVVPNEQEDCAALCIVKHETTGEHGFVGRVLKVCTLTVAPSAFGRGYGELLLKTVFEYACANEFDWLYLEVFPRHGDVIALVNRFGFGERSSRTSRGELVLAKRHTFTEEDYSSTDALEFNRLFGPRSIKVDGVRGYAVPIQPRYHAALFPESEQRRSLFQGRRPYGNAIRKAYLCNAPIRVIDPGSLLLFYRSHDEHVVRCIGVAEGSIRSEDPLEILSYVGTRTVYPLEEIEKLCQSEVLAILFRHARTLEIPFDEDMLVESGIMKRAPQSIAEIPPEGMTWLTKRLTPLS